MPVAAPAPALLTVRVNLSRVKVAVTFLAVPVMIVTWQVVEVLPLHSRGVIALVHPVKVDPCCAVAVKVTNVLVG